MHDISTLIQILRQLNELERPSAGMAVLSPLESRDWIERLKDRLPTSILGHHDRMITSGRNSLTTVSNTGRCGSCGAAVPQRRDPSAAAMLDVCDHCGAFLAWPEHRAANPPAPKPTARLKS